MIRTLRKLALDIYPNSESFQYFYGASHFAEMNIMLQIRLKGSQHILPKARSI